MVIVGKITFIFMGVLSCIQDAGHVIIHDDEQDSINDFGRNDTHDLVHSKIYDDRCDSTRDDGRENIHDDGRDNTHDDGQDTVVFIDRILS
jgi:hypothetical protein